jgi:membrane associated rhomboid family serine protease
MIFPIGDTNIKGGYKPYFSYGFIAINVLIFLFELSMSEGVLNQFFINFGVIPAEISRGQDWETIFSSIFLHGGWSHLIGNMMFLWVFGDNIEATVGNMTFMGFYLLGGLAATLGQVYMAPGSEIPLIGASGAIAAVLGAYLVMFPNSKVDLLILFLLAVIPIRAVYFLGIWIVQQLFNGYATLSSVTSNSGGVAWWAHIYGFLFGVLGGFVFRLWLKRTNPNYA